MLKVFDEYNLDININHSGPLDDMDIQTALEITIMTPAIMKQGMEMVFGDSDYEIWEAFWKHLDTDVSTDEMVNKALKAFYDTYKVVIDKDIYGSPDAEDTFFMLMHDFWTNMHEIIAGKLSDD